MTVSPQHRMQCKTLNYKNNTINKIYDIKSSQEECEITAIGKYARMAETRHKLAGIFENT